MKQLQSQPFPRLKKYSELKLRLFFSMFSVFVCSLCSPAVALATAGDPLTVVGNLSTFIFGLIRAVGLILLGWSIVQIGLSLKSHDPSQRANAFLTIAGGIIITFAKEILDLIV